MNVFICSEINIMQLEISIYPFGVRPDVTRPDHAFLTHVGEDGIRKMVADHYDLLRTSAIKHLFPPTDEGFAQAKVNSADFMIQIMGGPQYFNEHRGKPMMAARHSKFSITPEGRIVWLECYREVLLKLDAPQHLILSFWNYLNIFSVWMVNTRQEA